MTEGAGPGLLANDRHLPWTLRGDILARRINSNLRRRTSLESATVIALWFDVLGRRYMALVEDPSLDQVLLSDGVPEKELEWTT